MAERLEELSVGRVVPSVLTLLGLCSGITAIRFAIETDWYAAVAAIIFAMLFDMLDGRAARFLGADTRFGAQLDSLADLVSFGVAPGVLVYMWSLSRMGNAGWIAALIFCACSAIRLARFNVQSVRDEGSSAHNPYFTGLPTPAAAGLLLLPMLLSFESGYEVFRDPIVSGTMIALSASLMVSRLPTPSIKYMRPARQHRLLVWACIGVLAAFMLKWPWITLTVGMVIYLTSIPLGLVVQARRARAHSAH
ncbi:MAG TPA: CDP-diacylglycerol--serine O-phosphatidyltransferase [Rhizomicrobium sp.]|nr:CDP-diacylglycerol--serine O-phosphatidyltransferase [Rhizomicrobium sp.]